MKGRLAFCIVMGVVGFFLMMLPRQAMSDATNEGLAKGAPQLSPERLDVLDRRGYFTPGFKAAVHEMVNVQLTLEQAKKEERQLRSSLPDLQEQANAAEAKAESLHQELAKYDHPEEIDFVALQGRMKDAKAKPAEQIALAQAYVWSYPGSSHLGEVQQIFQQLQKQQADQQQSEKDAIAAKAAARASLLQRAQAKDLKLGEWNEFLQGMSQEDVLKYLGRPQTLGQDYWLYTGAWTTDPYTGQKVGITVGFNGTRVNGVSVGPVAP